MSNSIVAPKSYGFALKIIDLYKYLVAEKREFVLSRQMLRSGTAIGALIREAEHAQSRADFLNKMNIALKEANETEYWLMLLGDANYVPKSDLYQLHENCIELIRILASTVKKLKVES